MRIGDSGEYRKIRELPKHPYGGEMDTELCNRMDEAIKAPTSGERVLRDLASAASYAEEVSEILYTVTKGIIKDYPRETCAEDPSAMEADYYPDYFAELRGSTCRIRTALSRIQDIAQRIDL